MALMIGLGGVLGSNVIIAYGIPFDDHKIFVALTLFLALLLIVTKRPVFYQTSTPSLVFWVPFLSHLYLLMAGLISGAILNPPYLLWVALLMGAIALYLHRHTIQYILMQIKTGFDKGVRR
jgi:hypothetical protein